jgi:pimeloyl-ACP methyl ester carboxylesterase
VSIKRFLKIALTYLVTPLLLLFVVITLSLLAYRGYLQRKLLEESAETAPNGIDVLQKVELGGVEQWILIRGSNKSNPVLLFLHGGPGSADISLARHFDGDLVKYFVVVHWDQRGAGKSYNSQIPVQSMKRGQFVSDICELTEMLKARFHVPRVYLVGHSWGSEIGVLAASSHPELFQAYVGVGQVVDKAEQEEISYRFALDSARKSGDEKAIAELEAIGAPPYDSYRKLAVQRRWLERFGGVSHNHRITFSQLLKTGLTSPDYSLLDGLRFFRGQEFSERHLWEERLHTNLFREVPKIDIPVYFFVGRYDYNTPSELTERYYQQVEAPRGKQLVWFENSAHMIPYEEPQKYCAELGRVLAETSGTGAEGKNQLSSNYPSGIGNFQAGTHVEFPRLKGGAEGGT